MNNQYTNRLEQGSQTDCVDYNKSQYGKLWQRYMTDNKENILYGIRFILIQFQKNYV